MGTSHPTIKLSYFDFHGGRGEAARVALSIGGIPFEDHRVTHGEWAALKATTPFGGVPVLEVDGKRISQSNAINRYVGRLTGLYPEDPWQAALCDQVGDAVEALYAELLHSFQVKDPEVRERERAELVAGAIPRYLRGFAALLAEQGGEWFADGRLTVADLKMAEGVRHLSTGKLDHIPKDIVRQTTPTLADHRERVLAHPGVKAYYDRFAA